MQRLTRQLINRDKSAEISVSELFPNKAFLINEKIELDFLTQNEGERKCVSSV